MTFLAPERLWLLLAVLAMLAAYVLAQGRRRRHAVRFAALPLLARVAPSPGWRRHLPAGLFLVMAVLLVTGFARPEADMRVPREQATVVVALDVSWSMRARDITPDRFTVARDAAVAFVRQLPDQYRVGLVPFSAGATIAVAPTTDHALVEDAIRRLQPQGATAIGDAIVAATGASQQTAPASVASASEQAGSKGAQRVPARVVLLSDGANSSGVPVTAGIEAAVNSGVRVSTIAYGTDGGLLGRTAVPVDRETLRTIAEQTGGRAYEAATAAELREVYEDLGSSLGFRVERTEITSWFVGLGLAFALLAALASLRFTGRLP
jgi:Ca-activated chloride channel family protein